MGTGGLCALGRKGRLTSVRTINSQEKAHQCYLPLPGLSLYIVWIAKLTIPYTVGITIPTQEADPQEVSLSWALG